MKISNKTHRVASIVAAVLLILTLVSGIISNVSYIIRIFEYQDAIILLKTILSTGLNAITILLMIIALFRGKKDVVAGVFFIITAVYVLAVQIFGNVSNIILYLTNGVLDGKFLVGYVAASVIIVIASLINIAFRMLIALECFTPGKISGTKTKTLLLVLPIVNLLMLAVATVVRQFGAMGDITGIDMIAVLLPVIMSAVMNSIQNIGTVIMGLAFSIPVYEKNLYEYGYGGQPNFYSN